MEFNSKDDFVNEQLEQEEKEQQEAEWQAILEDHDLEIKK